MATIEDVTKVMVFLSALWPREEIGTPTYKAYHRILEDVPADALTAAAEKLGASATFFPKAAELRNTAFELIQGDELPLAMEGWHQIEQHWGGRSVEFHALTVSTIQRMGGLRKLGGTMDKDLPFVRAQFIKTFETLRNREIEDRRMLPAVREYKQLAAENHAYDQIKKLASGMMGHSQDEGELQY